MEEESSECVEICGLEIGGGSQLGSSPSLESCLLRENSNS